MPVISIYHQIKSGKIHITRKHPPIYRFWSKVDKDGPIHPSLGQCWIWSGLVTPLGYGHFRVDGRRTYTHRFSFELNIGPIPKGLCVLHSCDNPNCCNPKHLFLGTRLDNNKDRTSKGRDGGHKGTKNGKAKLTEKEARAFRTRYQSNLPGDSLKSIGRDFGLCKSAVSF